MALTRVKCVAPHPVDLDTGGVLGPGEWGKADLDHPHNADLVANGHIAAASEPEPKSKSKEQT